MITLTVLGPVTPIVGHKNVWLNAKQLVVRPFLKEQRLVQTVIFQPLMCVIFVGFRDLKGAVTVIVNVYLEPAGIVMGHVHKSM